MFFVFLAWGLANHRLAPRSWATPLSYGGDDILTLGYIKAASDLEFLPFLDRTIHRLGAPYTANWNDFPMFETLPLAVMGLVARASDLITAWHVGMLLSHLTSAFGFYAACRLLRFRREWAAAGALLWAFSFYHNVRCQGHLPICFDYSVPLGIVLCWFIAASRRFRIGGALFWLALLLGCAIGAGNPYNANMWLQFVCLVTGLRFVLFRRKLDLLAGALIVGATLLSFLAINLNLFVYQHVHGPNQGGLARAYNQLELGALKPIELFLPPPPHRLVWLTDFARQYASGAAVKGEMFSPYLGVVGVAALLWLVGEFLLRALNPQNRPRRVSLHAFFCGWVLLYAAIGGLNGVFGLLGVILFRSCNRFSLFILAVCLLFLVSRMSRLTRTWGRSASCALAVAITLFGLFDQTPLRDLDSTMAAVKGLGSDRAYGRALEKQLPAGAMLFQLPVMDFPESDPVEHCGPYDNLRPYLWTRNARFSFGSVKGRTREAWQGQVAGLSPEQLIKALEAYGFAGLTLNRKGYEDRAEKKLKALAACGKSELIEDEAHEQVCVVLSPSPHPVLPHSDEMAQIVYKKGWVMEEFGPDGAREWTDGSALLYFLNESPQDRSFHLTAVVTGWSDQRAEILFEGKSLGSRPLRAMQGWHVDLHLQSHPGRNYLDFLSDAQPQPPPGNAWGVRVAQGVINLQIIRDPQP
jgi:hypothetical protein